MNRQNVAVWVNIGLQVLLILGGLAVYLFALPSKDYIDSALDARIKPLEAKIESLDADIKELQDDIDRLNQNYIDHLAFHVKNKP